MSETADEMAARIRRHQHELNNLLAVAMAEAQLLLLDLEEGEKRDSIEVILQRLRSMRDVISSMNLPLAE